MWAWPQRLLLASYSPVPLAGFRFVFGLLLALDASRLLLHCRVLFERLPYRSGVPATPVVLAALWLVLALLLTSGLSTRFAALLNHLLLMFLVGQQGAHSQIAQDSVLLSSSLLLAMLPANRAFSVDAWLARKRGQPLGARVPGWENAFALLLSCIYVDSAVHKLASPLWLRGWGVWLPLSQPNLVWHEPTLLLSLPPLLLRLLGWGVIAFELLFPALWAWRRTRRATLALGLGLHGAIAWFYPLPAFSLYMAALYVPLVLSAARFGPAEVQSGAAPPPRRARLLLLAGAVSWLLLSLTNLLAEAHPRAREAWRPWGEAAFSLTGLLSHGVFSDALFVGYGYQLRLVPRGCREDRCVHPYRRGGLFELSVSDRVWEHWWKRTQAPWVRVRAAEEELLRFAAWWTGPPPRAQEFDLEARLQESQPPAWQAALWTSNLASPWRRLGLLRVSPSEARFEWRCAPTPSPGDALGAALRRCLEAPAAELGRGR